jgi:hypothetical protein
MTHARACESIFHVSDLCISTLLKNCISSNFHDHFVASCENLLHVFTPDLEIIFSAQVQRVVKLVLVLYLDWCWWLILLFIIKFIHIDFFQSQLFIVKHFACLFLDGFLALRGFIYWLFNTAAVTLDLLEQICCLWVLWRINVLSLSLLLNRCHLAILINLFKTRLNRGSSLQLLSITVWLSHSKALVRFL